jgi:hypothetical protein
MYVRWKRRERKTVARRKLASDPAGRTGRFLLSASLVVAERVGGKPRQRTLAYLASVAEDETGSPWKRGHFWTAADRKVATLDLSRADRRKAVAALAARVPRPTAAEYREADRRFAQLARSVRKV